MSDRSLGVTEIVSQPSVHNSLHPRQVCTKQEEEGEHQGDSEDGRPTAIDDCQVASATSAALPSIPNGTCIGDIAADMVDVMLSIAAELAPRSKRPRGAQGWCVDPGVQPEMNAAW